MSVPSFLPLVRVKGLEPPRLAAPEPKSGASANSATPACRGAKALYGRDVAMVAAQRLADGDYIRRETVAEVRLFTLRFGRDEVIYAGGLELACAAQTVTA
jgi:hypothetical protein